MCTFPFLEIDHCDNNDCQNGATCVPVSGSPTDYVCSCLPGYGGNFCEEGVYQLDESRKIALSRRQQIHYHFFMSVYIHFKYALVLFVVLIT